MRSNSLIALVLLSSMNACSAANGKDDSSPLVHHGSTTGDDAGDGIDPDVGGTGPGADFDAEPGAPLDETKDNDGDGYLFADDCDDKNKDVNPGAFDVAGDKVDNDCNGKVDDVDDCDTASLASDTKDPRDLARALGLCRMTSASAIGKAKTWGVIDVKITRADGTTGGVDWKQFGLFNSFGSAVKPRQGANLLALSSGTARTPGSAGYVMPLQPSFEGPSEVTPPAGWPKNSAGCPAPKTPTANDSVDLKLTIRVPTNAHGFSYAFDFYSSEYIEYVCSEFNDTFVAILQGGTKLDPKYAGNISFDSLGNPVNVNSGFFEVCTPGSKNGRMFPCAKGVGELNGTGFWYPVDTRMNGATSWLETKAPAIPGETITLQFMIWDTGDHVLDSTVLIDQFQWDAAASAAPSPVTDRPK